jgi:L-threonylcarbamoyladenylate synthase
VIVSIEVAARRLRDGGVVAYPTETVYGLGADARRADAVAHVRELKGRGAQLGISVLVSDLAAAEGLVGALPKAARCLAARFWPGPLTLVVPASDPALDSVRSERGVGLRCSSHPTAAALVRAARCPILSTSCNRSGEAPCRSVEEVQRTFGPALWVAGGDPAGGAAPSTVVALDRAGALEVLREGALPAGAVLDAAREGGG